MNSQLFGLRWYPNKKFSIFLNKTEIFIDESTFDYLRSFFY